MSSAAVGVRSFGLVLAASAPAASDGAARAATRDCSPPASASELADCSSRVCVSAAASATPCETAGSGGVREGPEASGVVESACGCAGDDVAADSVFGEGRVRCTVAPCGIGLDARCADAATLPPAGARCTRLEGRCVAAAAAAAAAVTGDGADEAAEAEAGAGAALSKSIRLLLTELPTAPSRGTFEGSEPRRMLLLLLLLLLLWYSHALKWSDSTRLDWSARWAQKERSGGEKRREEKR